MSEQTADEILAGIDAVDDADEDAEVCGETYDHDLVTDYEGEDGTQSTCRRCGAELWSDAEEDDQP